AVGATEIAIYVADYAQSNLVPMPAHGLARKPMAIETTLGGRAYTSFEIQLAPDHPDRVWVPLVDGCERIGVLEVVTPAAASDRAQAAGRELAACVAQLIKSRRAYGDIVERLRRRLPMQVAAEIVWGLLPPLTFATSDVMVTAILEPCYDVGGDVFDYALNGDVLSVGLFDTCGHGIKASTLASLAVNAYRNARRCGLDLADTSTSIDKWLRAEHPNLFATALLAELDWTTGALRLINAGHPGAQLLRDGKVVRELPGPTALPLGLGHMSSRSPFVHEEQLQAGDRLLAYTDGVTDALNAEGERFGLARLTDLVERALNDQLPTPETMRRLVSAVVAHQYNELQDDATAVLLEWRPSRNPLALADSAPAPRHGPATPRTG
ncbi:MAG TPA: PP2C family protein-serine/threonine phosphatase, partial [Micromonosporaceae bacterium]|nr:PP2C family protein-serine/threonine phosphatase [Micromonosporaceae bacterium]